MVSCHISRNSIHCILLTLALAGLPVLSVSGCATQGKKDNGGRTFKLSSAKTFSSMEAGKAAEPIDRYAAFQMFFKLDRSVDAISVGISAEYTADITGARKIKKTYFIVERVVDMSNVKFVKNKYLYAELGRNFDADWNREKEITIVSKKSEPFKDLDGASLYRVRFTIFSPENVDYTLRINADCGVTFLDDFR